MQFRGGWDCAKLDFEPYHCSITVCTLKIYTTPKDMFYVTIGYVYIWQCCHYRMVTQNAIKRRIVEPHEWYYNFVWNKVSIIYNLISYLINYRDKRLCIIIRFWYTTKKL